MKLLAKEKAINDALFGYEIIDTKDEEKKPLGTMKWMYEQLELKELQHDATRMLMGLKQRDMHLPAARQRYPAACHTHTPMVLRSAPAYNCHLDKGEGSQLGRGHTSNIVLDRIPEMRSLSWSPDAKAGIYTRAYS